MNIHLNRNCFIPVVGVTLGLTLVLASGCQITPPPPAEQDRTPLQEADRRAKALDPDLIVFQAEGQNGAAPGSNSQTLHYEFIAADPNDPAVMWRLTYDLEDWAIPAVVEGPQVGTAMTDLTEVAITETDARTRLTNAGHTDDFFSWSLYTPLHPDYPDPLYSFLYQTEVVTINARTGQVSSADIDRGGALSAAPPADDSVSVQYIADASARIRETSENAIIIWAGGRDGDGADLLAASDTNVWDFWAIDLSATGVAAWTMQYNGEWTVQTAEFPPMGIEYLDLSTVSMDVVEAWTIAADAGYPPPYSSWEAFKPLHPGIQNRLYVLNRAGQHIIVDTETGAVSVE